MTNVFHTDITADRLETVLFMEDECSKSTISWSIVFLRSEEQFFTLKRSSVLFETLALIQSPLHSHFILY